MDRGGAFINAISCARLKGPLASQVFDAEPSSVLLVLILSDMMGCSGCLVGCGCAIGGLTIGTFIGKRLGEQHPPLMRRKSTRKLTAPVQDMSGESPRGSLVLQNCFTDHDSTSIFNATLELWWPHLKSAIETVLRTEVEPKLQEELPGPLKGLSFTTVNLGDAEQCPLNIVKVQPVLDERISPEHGKLRCVRMVLGVDLESEVCVELQLKMLKEGVNFVKIRGSMVVEFYNLQDTLPVYNGLRVYFSDKPDLDLTMSRGVGKILNTAWLKSILIKVILTELSQELVLPNRLYVPPPPEDDAKEKESVPEDIIRIKAPRPEGMLRLVIQDVEGLDGVLPKEDTPWFVGLEVGTHSCRTGTRYGVENGGIFDKCNIFDFVVHDSDSQHVKITLCPQSHSVMWGYYPGEPLGTCFYHINDFISQGFSKCVLKKDAQQNPEQDSEQESVHPRRLSRRITSSFDGWDDNDHGKNSVKLSIKAEWGKLSRNEEQATALTACHLQYSGWERPQPLDAVAVVLIGIRRASRLSKVQAKYWCVTSVTHVAAGEFDTSGKDGSITLTSKAEKARRCEIEATAMPEASEIQAIWDAAYFVPLYDPCHARVEINVISDFGNIGTVRHDVFPLLHKHGLKEDYEDVLLPAQSLDRETSCGSLCGQENYFRKSGLREDYEDFVPAVSLAQEENGRMTKSSLYTCLRVWVLENVRGGSL